MLLDRVYKAAEEARRRLQTGYSDALDVVVNLPAFAPQEPPSPRNVPQGSPQPGPGGGNRGGGGNPGGSTATPPDLKKALEQLRTKNTPDGTKSNKTDDPSRCFRRVRLKGE